MPKPLSNTERFRHVPTSGQPRQSLSVPAILGIVAGVLGICYFAVRAIVPAFNPVSAPTELQTSTVHSVQSSATAETPQATMTGTPEMALVSTHTPEIQFTLAIELPALTEADCVSPTAERVEARVARVLDGDTILVTIEGQNFSVRYIGVDSPETGSDFASEASTYNARLLAGGTVILVKDVSETDKYDRLLRYVFANGKFVNYEMVKSGYAESGSWPPDTACDSTFSALEKTSKLNQMGMWAAALPLLIPTQPAAGAPLASPTPPQASADCPNGCTSSAPGCLIKGNINSEGEKIYHMPGQAYYEKTVISPDQGERWFCTEAEATANGWRKSKR